MKKRAYIGNGSENCNKFSSPENTVLPTYIEELLKHLKCLKIAESQNILKNASSLVIADVYSNIW